MDRIAFWNVRGLHAPNKQRELAFLCNKNKIGLLGMIESKMKTKEMCSYKFFRDWRMENNLHSHPGGRIWVLWRPQEYEVVVLMEHAQFLHLRVKSKVMRMEFQLTIVYGDNRLQARKKLWSKLCGLARGIAQP